ncbi:MAG: protein translocase subunit SecF, partial [Steroidobacteraceae bacterium]
MEFFRKKTSYPFMATRKRWYVVSAIVVLGALLALGVRGLNFGIDFTGGVVLEMSFPQAADLEKVRSSLEKAGYGDAVVQSFGTPRDVLVRLLPEAGTDNNLLGRKVLAAIQSENPGVELRRTEVVGGQVGAELAEKGALAVLFTFFFIMLYVWMRFQWKLGVGAIVAALHDPIIILGFFAATQMTFDLPSLAAILAVIGYSLNDTVVVFDRIRERFVSMRKGTSDQVIDASINETLSRTIMTSLTTMLTV